MEPLLREAAARLPAQLSRHRACWSALSPGRHATAATSSKCWSPRHCTATPFLHGLHLQVRAATGSSVAASSKPSRKQPGDLSDFPWPEQSFVFEPPWESSPLPKAFLYVPNMLETYFSLREVQGQLRERVELGTIHDFNSRFMARFLQLHSDVEAARRMRLQGSARVAAQVALAGGKPELAAVGARLSWEKERPLGARAWEAIPHSCQVVQARRAEHHDRHWVQVTVRLAVEERWIPRSGMPESRLREHFVVYELPRGETTGSHHVQDFRIAEFKTDV